MATKSRAGGQEPKPVGSGSLQRVEVIESLRRLRAAHLQCMREVGSEDSDYPILEAKVVACEEVAAALSLDLGTRANIKRSRGRHP